MDAKAALGEFQRALGVEAEAIFSLQKDVDENSVGRVIELLAKKSGRVHVAGCGTSAMAARKIAHSLSCIEVPAHFLIPSDAAHGALGTLQPGDVLILVSKGGSTAELAALIPACKAKGVKIIGVTENPESVIAREADIPLIIRVEREPCRFNMLATASTLAVIAVFDAICIALMQETGYTRARFAIIHPGGAVGARLSGEEAT